MNVQDNRLLNYLAQQGKSIEKKKEKKKEKRKKGPGPEVCFLKIKGIEFYDFHIDIPILLEITRIPCNW